VVNGLARWLGTLKEHYKKIDDKDTWGKGMSRPLGMGKEHEDIFVSYDGHQNVTSAGKDFNNHMNRLLYVLPHMWTLDQGQTQQGDWTLIA
jgi:hypothetical protein